MIVADTSALISIASIGLFDTFLDEFEVNVTEEIIEELEETASYDDTHAKAAQTVLDNSDRLEIHAVAAEITSSRIDRGEGSAVALASERNADFLITDDLRALPELQTLLSAEVAISPIVLKALVKRGALTQDEAIEKVDRLAERRDWLGAPIYRRALELFETET